MSNDLINDTIIDTNIVAEKLVSGTGSEYISTSIKQNQTIEEFACKHAMTLFLSTVFLVLIVMLLCCFLCLICLCKKCYRNKQHSSNDKMEFIPCHNQDAEKTVKYTKINGQMDVLGRNQVQQRIQRGIEQSN
ncbi:hypothetical protein VCUG_01254 [Vavraia culicis subsp. floridensis]|uniref:Uncharacterized protein n=1 Tax=Vavraia culicis (isolate floridensis) TaxID=948595 RepID=L2GVD8_VAVCU|nr:uncharacterized protein VCUG_01254 [Vavraia culicis subsp. floridensis]ELA47258.1 hypothetical protein VCUG_01254 [Vavraia culicis subsp. floridensis]